jgi:transposase
MARMLLIPDPENATIEELKQVSRVGSNETATRCSAIQMLLAGASRDLVCNALLVTDRALRKWINLFNHSGVDGLIVKKRPGRMTIIKEQQIDELSELLDQPEDANRTFWTAKAFHGYISEAYQIQCSYETVVRFFHKQGFALKTPQPWPDRQDEQLRQAFIDELSSLLKQPDIDTTLG